MKAIRPSVTPAAEAVRGFRADKRDSLSPQDRTTLDEIIRRLNRLDIQCGQLINLNNVRAEERGLQVAFDPSSDNLILRHGNNEMMRIKLEREDPDIPISMHPLAAGEAYDTGAEDMEGKGLDSMDLDFEDVLENYYYNAHRILKLVQSLPGFRSFRCREITIVRNKLVEHPIKGETYSFGFGNTGPVVRPFHAAGRGWIDQGLVPNTEAFVIRLVEAFGRSGTPA